MEFSSKTLCGVSLLFFVFVMAGNVFGGTPLLPADITIGQDFVPGTGAAVGEIREVSGKVAVIHVDDAKGYWAKEGNKLFKGDTLVTLSDAFVSFRLSDDSFMTLSPETKLIITKSLYAPEKQTRSAFINMVVGKTHFIVKKLVEASHSEFKVKTVTSVAGVRGSDFIIDVDAEESVTKVTALQNTELEVASLAAPDASPMILHDYESTSIRRGMIPTEARKVSAEEVDRLMKEFKFKPKPSSPLSETGAGQDQAQAGSEKGSPPSETTYPVRDEDLVNPDFAIPQTATPGLSLDNQLRSIDLQKQQQDIENTKVNINQQQSENAVKKLPLPPAAP